MPVLRRHLAKLLEGAPHGLLAIGRHLRKGLGSAADLLLALGGKVLEGLVACQDALPLLGRLLVEGVQAIDEPLLLVGRQIAEAGLAPERVLLLLRRQVLVVVEPLRKMLRAGADVGVGGLRPGLDVMRAVPAWICGRPQLRILLCAVRLWISGRGMVLWGRSLMDLGRGGSMGCRRTVRLAAALMLAECRSG